MFALRRISGAPSSYRAFSTSTPRPLAKMQLIGRLTSQPESFATSTGRDVVRYSLAVNHGPRDESGNRATSYFRVASFSEGPQKDLLLSQPQGALLYLEADAKMDTFQDQEGKNRTQLNLLQRNFELLSRPQNRSNETTGVESDTNAAEEPLSGVGQS